MSLPYVDSPPVCIRSGVRGFTSAGCPIRGSWDESRFGAPTPSLSQLNTPFFVSSRLGILHTLLSNLTTEFDSSELLRKFDYDLAPPRGRMRPDVARELSSKSGMSIQICCVFRLKNNALALRRKHHYYKTGSVSAHAPEVLPPPTRS